MVSRDYTTKWIIFWGIITIVFANSGTEWGIYISIATFILVLGGTCKAVLRAWRLKYPFSVRRCGVSSFSYPILQDFQQGLALSYFKNQTEWSRHLDIKSGKVILCVQLKPMISIEIASVNVRCVPEEPSVNRPSIIQFNEIHSLAFENTKDDQRLGRFGEYKQPRNVHEGRDLYFIIDFEANGIWEGKLSIRFYINNQRARSIRIPIKVNYEKESKKD